MDFFNFPDVIVEPTILSLNFDWNIDPGTNYYSESVFGNKSFVFSLLYSDDDFYKDRGIKLDFDR